MSRVSCLRASSCSQIRKTRQPARRNVWFTNWSRFLFAENLRSQNARLLFGCLPCFGQPCQKQPSTKTVSRCLRKVKSGFPGKEMCLRQPLIFFRRKKRTKTNSVSLFPRPRTRDITSERFFFVQTSAISSRGCHLDLK